jgi:hypothetical protein
MSDLVLGRLNLQSATTGFLKHDSQLKYDGFICIQLFNVAKIIFYIEES